jgi:hypothetical protein
MGTANRIETKGTKLAVILKPQTLLFFFCLDQFPINPFQSDLFHNKHEIVLAGQMTWVQKRPLGTIDIHSCKLHREGSPSMPFDEVPKTNEIIGIRIMYNDNE